jgi:hypothetical protein
LAACLQSMHLNAQAISRGLQFANIVQAGC